MSRSFDAVQKKNFLLGPSGVQFRLAASFERAVENRALWTSSEAFVKNAIFCIFLGLTDEKNALLEKAKTWMVHAIKIEERARNFEETSRKFHLALYSMIRWLADGCHDQQSLNAWLEEEAKYFAKDPSRRKTIDVALSAACFLDAGAYAPFLELAAPDIPPGEIKLTGSSEKSMAAAIAAQELAHPFKPERLQETITKFLDAHVGDLVSNGHAIRAAQWMKVVYWKRGTAGLTPEQAVRKCLDHVEVV